MPSYRFCRPDDIPYLVRALNECYFVHFPDRSPMTVDRFRDEMKRLDVWPSNSMVASTNTGPVAVMIGTKRSQEVLIQRVGVHPDHQRQGHALHMMTSLSQKLAVLGPERLIVEVPRGLAGLQQLVEAADYEHELTYTDYLRPPSEGTAGPEEWVVPVDVGDLLGQDWMDDGSESAWVRAPETLSNSQGELKALALASPERLEAALIFDPEVSGDQVTILALGAQDPERGDLFLGLLVNTLAARHPGHHLRLPNWAPTQEAKARLLTLGFQAGASHDRFGAVARPA